MKKPRSAATLTFLILLIFISGCGFFNSQKAETPTDTQEDTPQTDTQTSQPQQTSKAGKTLVEGKQVSYGINYDPDKWVFAESSVGAETEYEFDHVDGDVYAVVIAERIPIPLKTLKQIALDNAKAVGADFEITYEEMRKVNNQDMLAMKMRGSIDGIAVEYYGYYYSGDSGSIQFITYTGQNLVDDYQDELTELLNGLEVSTTAEAKISRTPSTDSSGKEKTVIKGAKVNYGITYDESKWLFAESAPGSESEYEFDHTDGDVYAMVIAERIEIPLETLKEIAIENAQAVATNLEVTFEEKVTLNGKEMLAMKMRGKIDGIELEYFGYYYSSPIGSIQFLTYTSPSLSEFYQNDLTELLNGLEVYE